MENIAAAVIAYHPGEYFIKNISTYLNKVAILFIADNSEPNFIFPEEILSNKKIILVRDGENKGIAFRLNQIAEISIKKGLQWLLTMDQDSYFEEKQLDHYLLNVVGFEEKNKVAMFGIEHEKPPEFTDSSFKEKTTIITSGSILNLQLFDKTGHFDEALFIDEVDHEYCYRAIEKGFLIIQFTHIFMHHQLGEIGIYHSLKNMKKTARALHTPLRIYYMVRNFLYLRQRYQYLFKDDLHAKKRGLLNRLKNNLLYGKQKYQTLKMLAKALYDYRKGKTGRMRN